MLMPDEDYAEVAPLRGTLAYAIIRRQQYDVARSYGGAHNKLVDEKMAGIIIDCRGEQRLYDPSDQYGVVGPIAQQAAHL